MYLPHVPQQRKPQPFSLAHSTPQALITASLRLSLIAIAICLCMQPYLLLLQYFSPPHMLKYILPHLVAHAYDAKPLLFHLRKHMAAAHTLRWGVHSRVYNLWRHS